jgi:hypothetical protein
MNYQEEKKELEAQLDEIKGQLNLLSDQYRYIFNGSMDLKNPFYTLVSRYKFEEWINVRCPKEFLLTDNPEFKFNEAMVLTETYMDSFIEKII